MLLQLLRYFRDRGHKTTVVVGQDCAAPIVDNYRVFSTQAQGWQRRLRDYRSLVEQTKPDALYYISGIEEANLLRFMSCVRVRHVFTLEQHDLLDVPYWLRQLAPYWEICTANTPDVLEGIKSNDRCEYLRLVVPYYVDPAFHSVSPESMRSSGGPRNVVEVCYIGRMESYQKRAHWIPEIVQRCRAGNRQLRWHIYGEGPCEGDIREELKRRNCGDLVEFHGWLESQELPKRIARHDIFLSCSRYEGLPVAMVEAMFCGLACVAPDIPGGVQHLIRQGGGWLYDARTPRHASEALIAAAKDGQFLEVKKKEARGLITQLCGAHVAQERYAELERAIRNVRFNGRVADLENARRIRLVPFRALWRRQFRLLCLSKKGAQLARRLKTILRDRPTYADSSI